ncbi:MAG: SpoVA/SpoVAEb family sporulation membrane protein [Anaerovoracaceae bacterium]
MPEKEAKDQKKQVAKAYEEYASQFTPKPKYVANSVKAFVVGGSICVLALLLKNYLGETGLDEETAGNYVTIILVMTAQLLTGIGVFDIMGKFAGAGVIVPITGFANAMVAPAIEYKKEGVVLGIGAKLFSLAGPVLVCGITVSGVIGIIYWLVGRF